MKQVTRQLPMQGAKHILQDIIIAEVEKLRPYLDYILDKEIVIQAAKQSVAAVKEVLNKNPIDTANNTLSFLSGLTEDDLKTTNIKEKISIITWERKVVRKHQHQHLNIVQAKIDIMNHQIKLFIDLFSPLCKKGLPFFWEEKGKMLCQTEYHAQLVKVDWTTENLRICNNPCLEKQ